MLAFHSSIELIGARCGRCMGRNGGKQEGPLSVEVLGSEALREVGFPVLTHAAGSVSLRGGSPEAALELELALTRVEGALSAAAILATHLDGVTFDGTVTISYNRPDSCN